MGRCYAFSCPRCSHEVRVSGGEDQGRHCFTQTVFCRDCKELYDVITHVRRRGGARRGRIHKSQLPGDGLGFTLPAHAGFSGVILNPSVRRTLQLLPHRPASLWMELATECPRNKSHRVTPWKHPGKCPRCETLMERTIVPSLTWE